MAEDDDDAAEDIGCERYDVEVGVDGVEDGGLR
jgi:hypothetical protein